MKTPREILLARHHAAEPKLDAVRRTVIAEEFNHQDNKTQSWLAVLVTWCLGGSQVFWRELIFPCRRIWAGLAATWILIIAVNFSTHDKSQAIAMKSSPAPEMILSFGQQEKLLTELIGPNDSPAAEPAKPFLPRPSSERQFEVLLV